MSAPDISKHLKEIIGGLVLELATAKAVIEQQETALAEAKAGREPAGEPPAKDV